jgi:hypothetical protein
MPSRKRWGAIKRSASWRQGAEKQPLDIRIPTENKAVNLDSRARRSLRLTQGSPSGGPFSFQIKGIARMEHALPRDIGARRDRLSPRLAEMARKLSDPTPANIAIVRAELDRLSKG